MQDKSREKQITTNLKYHQVRQRERETKEKRKQTDGEIPLEETI